MPNKIFKKLGKFTMWTKEKEEAFQALIKKYQENPQQKPNDDENKLMQTLMECYLNAKPGKEMDFFKKISSFHNIFLEAYLKAYPEILTDGMKLEQIPKEHPPQTIYPFLEEWEEMMSWRVGNEPSYAVSAYDEFIGKLPSKTLLTEDQRELLDPSLNHTFPYARPEQSPTDFSTLPYDKLVQKIYRDAQEKHGSDVKLKKKRDKLIQTYYRWRRTNCLNNLNVLYNTLDLRHLAGISHIFYNKPMPNLHQNYYLYPDYTGSFTQDILPHPIFGTTLLTLAFQNIRRREKEILEREDALEAISCGVIKKTILQLIGKTFENNEAFPGYKILLKTVGKDAGFILVSPDGSKKYYIKHTERLIPEYFCSKLLSHLGIKMPEAQLLIDKFGNQLYMTMDLSRQYTKDKHMKTKNFQSLTEELGISPSAPTREEDAPTEEREKLVNSFVNEVSQSKESRKSFAKLLLVGTAFGLSDLGGHGGNVGLIRAKKRTGETEESEKRYIKFGIVDFQFYPTDITNILGEKSYVTMLSSGMQVMCPIFKKIFDTLTPQDFIAAAKELAKPKQRVYKNEGLLLTSGGLGSTNTSQVIIENIFEEVAKELREKLPKKEANEQIAELEAQKNIIIKNLEVLIDAVQKTEVAPDNLRETSRVPRPEEMQDLSKPSLPSSSLSNSSETSKPMLLFSNTNVTSSKTGLNNQRSCWPKKELTKDEWDTILSMTWEPLQPLTDTGVQTAKIMTSKEADAFKDKLAIAGINTGDMLTVGNRVSGAYQCRVELTKQGHSALTKLLAEFTVEQRDSNKVKVG